MYYSKFNGETDIGSDKAQLLFALCIPYHVTPRSTHLILSHMTSLLPSPLISPSKGEVKYAQILLECSSRVV